MSGNKKAGLLNASERDGVDYKKASLLEMLVGMANNGTNVTFYLIIGFASMIASQGYAIPMTLAGVLITGTRVLDGAVDPFFAAFFDRFNPKKGKIRILLIIGWAITSLGLLVMYSWAAGHFEGAAGVVMFLLAYVIFIIGYNVNGIAGGTVGIIITNDPTQRPMTGVIGTIYSYGVPLILTNLITFVILPKYDNQYSVAMLSELVVWFIAVALVFVLLACFGLRKVDVRETFETLDVENGGAKEEKVSFRDMVAVLKDNRPLQMYILTGVSDKLAQQTMSQSVVNNMMAGVLIGSYAASTMVGNFSQIVGIFFAFGSGVFIAKMGAKKATTVWSWISIAISAATVLLCLAVGGPNGMSALGVMGVPIIIYAVLTLCRTGASMALTTAGSSMRADIVDYEYERSGNYMPAVVSAIYSLIDQIVSSLGSTIAAVGISFVGYANSVPQMGDTPTWPIFWMTMFLMFGMPILGWLCNIIAMRFYKLDRERMIQVQKTINTRKEEAEKLSAANSSAE